MIWKGAEGSEEAEKWPAYQIHLLSGRSQQAMQRWPGTMLQGGPPGVSCKTSPCRPQATCHSHSSPIPVLSVHPLRGSSCCSDGIKYAWLWPARVGALYLVQKWLLKWPGEGTECGGPPCTGHWPRAAGEACFGCRRVYSSGAWCSSEPNYGESPWSFSV